MWRICKGRDVTLAKLGNAKAAYYKLKVCRGQERRRKWRRGKMQGVDEKVKEGVGQGVN